MSVENTLDEKPTDKQCPHKTKKWICWSFGLLVLEHTWTHIENVWETQSLVQLHQQMMHDVKNEFTNERHTSCVVYCRHCSSGIWEWAMDGYMNASIHPMFRGLKYSARQCEGYKSRSRPIISLSLMILMQYWMMMIVVYMLHWFGLIPTLEAPHRSIAVNRRHKRDYDYCPMINNSPMQI